MRLLSRTTRRVNLTEEGARYYERAIQILQLVDQAAGEARSGRSRVAGTVRISFTAAFGVLHISRLIFEFQDAHPEITVDLSLNDERVDLVRSGFDLAIRLGPLTDSSMKLRRLGWSRQLLVAAPAYLAERGRPAVPHDLAAHECVRMSNIAGSNLLVLHGPAGQLETVPINSRLRVDLGLAARQAFLAGRGIGPAFEWLVNDLLDDRLDVLLPDWHPEPVPLSMLLVPERAGVARVRLLADFLAQRIARLPRISESVETTS